MYVINEIITKKTVWVCILFLYVFSSLHNPRRPRDKLQFTTVNINVS